MFVPDYERIVQVMLHAEGLGLAADDLYMGFTNCFKELKDTCTKQDHYDFGLRAIKASTRSAGGICRSGVDAASACKTAMNNQYHGCFVSEDLPVLAKVLE